MPVPSAPVDSDAVKFDRMTATFNRTATGRLDLQEALIFNPEVGLTAQGFLDYPHDRVDINGTVVPAYQVNSLISGIPVVGLLFGGANHEGVFGANYRISGAASAPAFNVSMISAVTPGILRKLVGAFDGTTPSSSAPAAGRSAVERESSALISNNSPRDRRDRRRKTVARIMFFRKRIRQEYSMPPVSRRKSRQGLLCRRVLTEWWCKVIAR